MTEDELKQNGSEPPKLVMLPSNWPGQRLPLMPGDVSKYVPQGLGLDAPLVVRPWDDPPKALSGPSFYGFDAPETDPIRAAPSNLPAGGVVYFDGSLPDENVRAPRWVFSKLGAILRSSNATPKIRNASAI
jgi:hypothetical protein